MGIFTKFKDLIGIDEYEDEEVEYEDTEYRAPAPRERAVAPSTGIRTPRYDSTNVVPMQNKTVKAITNAFKLVVIEPSGFDECSKLVDNLKTRKPVIVNLENLDSETARKIFDFLGGATYALNGNVQKISNNIFVFAPENVAIFADGEKKSYSFAGESEDYNPWK